MVSGGTPKPIGPAIMHLHFSPSALLVSIVRGFVSDFYTCLIDDPEVVSRLAMAAHELLENATKYGAEGQSSITVEVSNQEPDKRATIRMRNSASPEDVARAEAILRPLAEAKDPFLLYQQAMRKTAREAKGSGLGLLRVCVEGEMRIRWSAEDGHLEIIAETDLGASS